SSLLGAIVVIGRLEWFKHFVGQISFTAQHHGPWRHKVKWETNGQVYSLLSTGSQYHTTVSGQRNPRNSFYYNLLRYGIIAIDLLREKRVMVQGIFITVRQQLYLFMQCANYTMT
uniref:Uncharacterized protein n=1 Tax=Sinocyclocheilus grahami TaxID=75366 RepID=A0A672MBV0_SINGR